jgi:glycine cleavage system H lipoate-binding protein
MKKQATPKIIGFNVLENECVWMKGGVVNFKLCDNVYDCCTCPFDKAMQKAMASKPEDDVHPVYEGKVSRWATDIKKGHKGETRLCRHSLTGRIDTAKICVRNYECFHCEYDQWMDETGRSEFAKTDENRAASGYAAAENYYYHKNHTWARFEHGGAVRVGFDDFLVRVFGPMDFIVPLALGTVLKQGEIGWEFLKGKHRVSVVSPVSGTVLAVNHKAVHHPHIVHADPYNEGWLFILQPDLPMKNTKKLFHGPAYTNRLEQEHKKLLALLGDDYRDLAATGGEPVRDIYGSSPNLNWDVLVDNFLKG